MSNYYFICILGIMETLERGAVFARGLRVHLIVLGLILPPPQNCDCASCGEGGCVGSDTHSHQEC